MFLATLLLAAGIDLTGTWTAQRTYPGPQGGAVSISTRGPQFRAKIGNQTAVSRTLSAFHFPDHSVLSVNRSKSFAIWSLPPNVRHDRYSWPISLAADSSGTLAGYVKPSPQTWHFDLVMQRGDDGSVRGFFRNPEENLGAFFLPRQVTVDGGTVHFTRPDDTEITGKLDPANTTLSIAFDALPGTYVFKRAIVPSPAPYAYAPPEQRPDGWQTGTLAAAGIDGAAITSIVEHMRETTPRTQFRAPEMQGLLIARHGKLVLEEYFDGFTADTPHDIRSAGKSITTLIAGKAMEETHAFSAATDVYTFLGNYGPFANDNAQKRSMTAGNLMSMSSGYACDDNDDKSPGNEDTMQAQTKQPDWYEFTLNLPMAYAPGSQAVYCTGGINLIGAMVAAVIPESLEEYFYDRFARPLQFGPYAMPMMPAPVSHAYMGGGERLLPRDFLKLGQLILNGGTWNGKRIVNAQWIKMLGMKQSHVKDELGDYSYGWHLYTFEVNGHTYHAINAGGNGGQLLFAIPELDLAIVTTAGNYNQYPVWMQFIQTLVPKQILPAVQP